MNLRPTSQTARDAMAGEIAWVQMTKLFDKVRTLWPRTNDAHLTAKDVEQLWKLVQGSLANHLAYRTQPIIMGDIPVCRRFGFVDGTKRTKLQDPELAAVDTDTHLLEQDSGATLDSHS